MKFDRFCEIWGIPPFGGDNSPENSPPDNSATPPNDPNNPPGGQGNSGQPPNSPPGGTPPENSENSDDDDPYEGLSSKELRRILRDSESNKSKAEKERDAAKAKLDEQERAKLSKEQQLEKDVADRDAIISTLRSTNDKLAIVTAIHADSRFEWHDPQIVVDLLNREVVKVDDKGNVEGMAKELARIAKEHEFLLKSKAGQSNQQQNNGPTGFQPGQGGANSGGTLPPQQAELVKSYPALSSRMPSS